MKISPWVLEIPQKADSLENGEILIVPLFSIEKNLYAFLTKEQGSESN